MLAAALAPRVRAGLRAKLAQRWLRREFIVMKFAAAVIRVAVLAYASRTACSNPIAANKTALRRKHDRPLTSGRKESRG